MPCAYASILLAGLALLLEGSGLASASIPPPLPPGKEYTPSWKPTWDMAASTIIMPCNYSGMTNTSITARWGLVDFDWSNGKLIWSNTAPMNCEELLLKQAQTVKSVTPNARVFVYRNLVKALPWYSSVREKMVDPQYSGWFLKFKSGDSTGKDKWNTPPCTTEANGRVKCSMLYHDQEQTPKSSAGASREEDGSWYIYNNTNDVFCLNPGYKTITSGGETHDWAGCRDAADAADKRIFGWFPTHNNTGDCWFSEEWNTEPKPGKPPVPVEQDGCVSGFKPRSGEAPPPALTPAVAKECESGECDCGEGLPCGEYLWDHRNQSLREWLINEFVLGNATGLGNPAIDGYYFDDSWHTAPDVVPSDWRQCDKSPLGGASEENKYCSYDMGLSKQDVADITGNWSLTGAIAKNAVLLNGGFSWGALSLFVGTGARAYTGSGHDPRKTCLQDHREWCSDDSTFLKGALLFEFTRKDFSDPFPLPNAKEDVASFLLSRGEYAWLGHNWMGCNAGWDNIAQLRPTELVDVDYGTPIDKTCRETAPGSGIFVRNYTKVSVQMDCNTFTGTLTMKS